MIKYKYIKTIYAALISAMLITGEVSAHFSHACFLLLAFTIFILWKKSIMVRRDFRKRKMAMTKGSFESSVIAA